MCVAAATEASAQDASNVLNTQLKDFDVFAGTSLNVTDQSGSVTSTTSARGNEAFVGVEGVSARLDSTQVMRGDAGAAAVITTQGDTEGRIVAITQAQGNYLSAYAYDGAMTIDAEQNVEGDVVRADVLITDDNARLLQGAALSSSATGNATALGGAGSSFEGAVAQSSSADIIATNFVGSQYLPGPTQIASEATANTLDVSSQAASNQVLESRQRSTGSVVRADSSLNAGNGWNLASQARSGGNRAMMYNQGGSVVNVTDQENSAQIQARAVATSYDYGAATVSARGAANEAVVGNNDIYLKLDNNQLNTGGVEVAAEFAGTNGYDAYVGAEAVGNTVTGYACSTCAGYMEVTNNQTNSANVSATASTTVHGSGRHVITGTTAVGNSATFYVSRP